MRSRFGFMAAKRLAELLGLRSAEKIQTFRNQTRAVDNGTGDSTRR